MERMFPKLVLKGRICGLWINELTNVSFNNSVGLDDDFSLIVHNKQKKCSLSLTSVLSHCIWQHTHSWFYFVDSVCSEWSISYEKYLMSFSNNPLNSMITSVNLSPEDKFTLVLFSKLAAATSMIVILQGILSIQYVVWFHIPLTRLPQIPVC